YSFGHLLLAYNLLFQNRADPDALDQCLLETLEGGRMNCLAVVYFTLGRSGDAELAVNESIRTRGDLAPFGIARTYPYLAQGDRTFEWIERAVQVRDSALTYIKADPTFAKFAGDPRYKALLQEMNLPE